MTEADQFAILDDMPANTIVAFSSMALAMRYFEHALKEGGAVGLRVGAEDTREGTGLYVTWLGRVPPELATERLANCAWALEEILAGRIKGPQPGQVAHVWPKPN